MTDIDTALRARLQTEIPLAHGEPPPFSRIERRATHRRHRRRALAGAGLAAVVGVAGLALSSYDSDDELETVGPGPTTATSDPAPAANSTAWPIDAIAEAPPPPLDVRGDAAVAWTGEELVVWGGDLEAFNMGLSGEDRSYADGAAYDPTTNTWRMLSESPLPTSATTPVAAMSSRGLAIARGTAVALWHPEDDSWEELPSTELPLSDLHATDDTLISATGNVRLNLGDDEWQLLPTLPDGLERPSSTWFGDGLFVIGGPGSAFVDARAFRYDLTEGEWRPAAVPPAGLQAEALAGDWDGQRIIVVNYDMRAAAYDPATDTWIALPDVPARFYEWGPTVVSTDQASLVFMAQSIVALTAQDAWLPVPYGSIPQGQLVSTRGHPSGAGRFFVWGVDTETAANTLTIVDVAALVSAGTSVQVGVAALPVPPGHQFVEATAQDPASPVATIRARTDGPSGTCDLTSTYRSAQGATGQLPIEEILPNDGRPTTWTRASDGRTWQTWPTTSDRVEITCDDPDIARLIAEGASFDSRAP